MISKITTGLALLTLLSLTSCNSTIDVAQERRATNERAFRAFADSTDFQRVTVPGITGSGFIYMKVTKAGDTSVGVDYTDAVTLFRDAYSTSDWIKDNLKAVQQETVAKLPIGLQIAVQNLHQGAEASIVVPWYLNTNNMVERTESYTSLYYRVRLGSVIKPSTK